MKTIVFSPEAPAPIGPYSQAVRAGNMLFISGQIAIRQSDGMLLTGNITEESRQVMTNLAHILKAAGLDFNAVIKTSVFLRSMDDFAAMNEVYATFFQSAPPARETVAVAGLPKNVNVEISMIACFPD